MEAMWMLAGRRDVEFVAQFNSHISTFSDDGVKFHGAYGHRWRNWFHQDQLKEVIKTLLYDPTSRRCVLQMWDCDFDLGKQGKDFPCNTHIYFDPDPYGLNMTVCNRSNDIIWGLYGANFVHMSFLHEFVARSVGMNMGAMYTLSNNFHCYPENLKNTLTELYEDSKADQEWYEGADWDDFQLLLDQPEESEQFLADVGRFCNNPADIYPKQTVFLNRVAVPMYSAWQCYKGGAHKESLKYCDQIQSPDWARACHAWVERRMK
jgi:thymidylate synthase